MLVGWLILFSHLGGGWVGGCKIAWVHGAFVGGCIGFLRLRGCVGEFTGGFVKFWLGLSSILVIICTLEDFSLDH